MKDWTAIRERYLRDNVPVRLGGLAANLSRIKSFSAHDASREAVESIIDESKFFIEWTAAEAQVGTAAGACRVTGSVSPLATQLGTHLGRPRAAAHGYRAVGVLVKARLRDVRSLNQIDGA